MKTIIKIENLHKQFKKIHAVNNLSLEIKKGNVYGLLGPNGSGKSTTLGIILGVVSKTSGQFTWFENEFSNQDALKKIGAIIERPNFYPYMSAYDNLKVVCKIKNIPYTKINEKLELVGLIERKNSSFKTFSLGMKQRLAIASALLNDPDLLILDEPTNGLDPQGIRQIRELIQIIAKQGTTILLASHLLDEVEKVCSHVIVLRNGITLFQGTVQSMMGKQSYFEINSTANTIEFVIQQLPNLDYFEKIDSKYILNFNTPTSSEFINEFFFKNNCTLTHLVEKKSSLEEEFLKLTT